MPNGKPNILLIMADDIGWFDVGAYHRGIMGGETPNIDRICNGGAIFTDAYAQASCTAGRAAFITGQIPMRTGMTKVGMPGAPLGILQQHVKSFEDFPPRQEPPGFSPQQPLEGVMKAAAERQGN